MQVAERAGEVWGSEEGLEKEMERREKEKEKTRKRKLQQKMTSNQFVLIICDFFLIYQKKFQRIFLVF